MLDTHILTCAAILNCLRISYRLNIDSFKISNMNTVNDFAQKINSILDKEIPTILKNKITANNFADAKATYLPHVDDTEKEDTLFNESGAKLITRLEDKLSRLEHPEGKTLEDYHGRSYVRKILDEILPQKIPDKKWASNMLAGVATEPWEVYISLKNISLDHSVSLSMCTLHPAYPIGMMFTPFTKSPQDEDYIKVPFIQVDVEAPNPASAHIKALSIAKVALAFCTSPYAGLVLAAGPETSSTFFCRNKITNVWTGINSSVDHRGTTFSSRSKFDLAHENALQRRLSKLHILFQSISEKTEVISCSSRLLQSSKVQDQPSIKLLLLVGALDTILMDKYYVNRHGKEFNKRLSKMAALMGVSPNAISFIHKVYKQRSDIVHSGLTDGLPRNNELHGLEIFVYNAITLLMDTTAHTHKDSLAELGLLDTSAPEPKIGWKTRLCNLFKST